VIWAVSVSTWEKSGLIAASTVLLAFGVHFVHTGVVLRRRGRKRAPEVAARRAVLMRHAERRDDPVPAGGKSREAFERLLVANEAVRVLGQPRREDLVAPVSRVVPVQHHPPRLGIRLRVSERRERDPDLERPAVVVDLRRRVPEPVRRVVLAAGRVGVDRVVLDPAGVREKEDRALLVVGRVEDDPPVVGRAVDVVPVGVGRADLLRVRIVELEADVEVLVVVGHPAHALHLRLDVVPGVRLPPLVDRRRILPGRIREVAVDDDRTGRPCDLDWIRGLGRSCGHREARGQRESGRRDR